MDDSVDTVDSFGQDQKHLAARPGYQGRSVEESHQAPGSDQRDLFSPPRGIAVWAGERVGRHRENGRGPGNAGISLDGRPDVVGEQRAVDQPGQRRAHAPHRTRTAIVGDGFGHGYCIDEAIGDLEPPAGRAADRAVTPACPADVATPGRDGKGAR